MDLPVKQIGILVYNPQWKDLSKERDGLEQDPKSHWLKPVHYWWPSQSKDKTL